MRVSCACRRQHAMYAAAAFVAAISAGCGGDGASPAGSEPGRDLVSVAASEDAASEPSGAAGSAQNGYEKAAVAYDRIESPAGGEMPIGRAEIAAVQEAVDKIGDELSSL
jgi:hypothetical protein